MWLQLSNLLDTNHNALVAPPELHKDISYPGGIVLISIPLVVPLMLRLISCPTNLVHHMTDPGDHDKLEFALHLTYHQLLVQTLRPRKNQEASSPGSQKFV